MNKLNNLKKRLIFSLCTIALCFAFSLGILNAPIASASSITAINESTIQTLDESTIQTFDYYEYEVNNLEPFLGYLNYLGYSVNDIPSISFKKYLQIYQNALDLEIIVPLKNDILLANMPKTDLGIGIGTGISLEPPVNTPDWSADKPVLFPSNSYKEYNESTHQFLADKAYERIQNDYPDLFGFIPLDKQKGKDNGKGTDWSNIVWYANWPDVEETDSWGPIFTNASHFYYPANGGNLFIKGGEMFLNLGGLSAKDRFIGHYNDAVSYYKGYKTAPSGVSQKTASFQSLGKALHYISDMATPVHTGYQVNDIVEAAAMGISPHSPFESYASDIQASFNYIINPNGWNTNLETFAHNIAVVSNALYTNNIDTLKGRAEQTLKNSANACASVLFRFAIDLGYSPREGNFYSAQHIVRTDTKLITDKGVFINSYDEINIKTTFGYQSSSLKLAGYNKVSIYMTFEMRELDDGYQELYLFYDTRSDTKYMIAEKIHEHGVGKKDSNWSTYTLVFSGLDIGFFHRPEAQIHDKLILRYGAHGVLSDDWENRNIKIQFYFYK